MAELSLVAFQALPVPQRVAHIGRVVSQLHHTHPAAVERATAFKTFQMLEKLPYQALTHEVKLPFADLIVALLEDPDAAVRAAASQAYQALPEQWLFHQRGAAQIVSLLKNSNGYVREIALQTFQALTEQMRATQADPIGSLLMDPNGFVRVAALQAFQALPEQERVAHAGRIVSLLMDPDTTVQAAALQAFQALPEQERVAHADPIVSLLEDSDAAVRVAALQGFQALPWQERVAHADRIVSLLMDPDAAVRAAALQAFQALPRQERVLHAARIVSLLEHPVVAVRQEAYQALQSVGALSGEVRARHIAVAVSQLVHWEHDDPDEGVRRAAVVSLAVLSEEERVGHATALIKYCWRELKALQLSSQSFSEEDLQKAGWPLIQRLGNDVLSSQFLPCADWPVGLASCVARAFVSGSLDLSELGHSSLPSTILPPSLLDYFSSLRVLNLSGNGLTHLPDVMWQLISLEQIDVSQNELSELSARIATMPRLTRLRAANNPLQMPPIGVVSRGMASVKAYFEELERFGGGLSRQLKLVVLGDGEAGKTSIVRGLKSCTPKPARADERTVQLDISQLKVGSGASAVTLGVWDLGGQQRYATVQQAFLVGGALYLAVVPAHRVEEHYDEVLGRWLDYLAARAPGAVVQLVLSHADKLLPGHTSREPMELARAASTALRFVRQQLKLHKAQQAALSQAAGHPVQPLRVQETIPCVCAVADGDASLLALRKQLETIVQLPALFPSVGATVPQSWLAAIAVVRALRDGRPPLDEVREVIDATRGEGLQYESDESVGDDDDGSDDDDDGSDDEAHGRKIMKRNHGQQPYIPVHELRETWVGVVAQLSAGGGGATRYDFGNLEDTSTPSWGLTLSSALQHLEDTGEVFSSCDLVFIDPKFVTDLVAPLLDHTLDEALGPQGEATRAEHARALNESLREFVLAERCNEAELRDALESLVRDGELREELLSFLWWRLDLGKHREAMLQMLHQSGVLFPAVGEQPQRRWMLPTRLPHARPAEVDSWWPDRTLQAGWTLLWATYTFSERIPAGVIERAIASVEDLGEMRIYWRKGALIIVPSTSTEQHALLHSPPPANAAIGPWHVHAEVRGTSIPHLRVLLARLCDKVDRILVDFPGLIPSHWQLACPQCLAAGRWDNAEHWKLADIAESRPCRKCCATVLLPTNHRELLVFVCSPNAGPLVNALPEAQDVKATCQGVVEIKNGGTAQELRQQLLAVPTRRFLFTGHADASDPSGAGHTLGFTKPGGGLELVNRADIASVMGRHGTTALSGVRLELVFLNGCCSEELGRAAIAAGIPTVVCWRTLAWDPAARLFARTFFQAIARGGGVGYRRAFEEAVSALRLVTHVNPAAAHQPAIPAYQLCGPASSQGTHSGPAWPQGPAVRYKFRCSNLAPRTCDCSRANFPLPFPCGEPMLIDAIGDYPASVVL